MLFLTRYARNLAYGMHARVGASRTRDARLLTREIGQRSLEVALDGTHLRLDLPPGEP